MFKESSYDQEEYIRITNLVISVAPRMWRTSSFPAIAICWRVSESTHCGSIRRLSRWLRRLRRWKRRRPEGKCWRKVRNVVLSFLQSLKTNKQHGGGKIVSRRWIGTVWRRCVNGEHTHSFLFFDSLVSQTGIYQVSSLVSKLRYGCCYGVGRSGTVFCVTAYRQNEKTELTA